MKKSTKGMVIASAVAALFASQAFGGDKAAPKKDTKQTADKVRCGGINECKGKGECGGANGACAGTNECKGQGWFFSTEKDCKAKGGKVLL
jgi:uncharacterized membrane protein